MQFVNENNSITLNGEAGWVWIDRIWFESRSSLGSAYQTYGVDCNAGTTIDSCAATNWYTVLLGADNDDGNLTGHKYSTWENVLVPTDSTCTATGTCVRSATLSANGTSSYLDFKVRNNTSVDAGAYDNGIYARYRRSNTYC